MRFKQQPHLNRQHQQQGFVLVMVIFLIVILGGAAVAISRFTVDNTSANIQALETIRARNLANSGIESAVSQLIRSGERDECELIKPQLENEFPTLSLVIDCPFDTYNGINLYSIEATVTRTGRSPSDDDYVWYRATAVVEP